MHAERSRPCASLKFIERVVKINGMNMENRPMLIKSMGRFFYINRLLSEAEIFYPSKAINAAPSAPQICGSSGRMSGSPVFSSIARRTPSFLATPPVII